jgi:SAM-dependent methyltransferase
MDSVRTHQWQGALSTGVPGQDRLKCCGPAFGAMSDAVARLVQSLAPCVAYKESNVEANRKVWNMYAKDWSPETEWVKRMAGNLGEEWNAENLTYVGDEWSDRASLQQVIDEFITPWISASSAVAEIGVGGGRVAVKIVSMCRELHCFDISSEMLKRARQAIAAVKLDSEVLVQYHELDTSKLPADFSGKLDFVYSFDCLPHCDLHTIHAYLKEFVRVLKPGGNAMIHTSNITSPGQASFPPGYAEIALLGRARKHDVALRSQAASPDSRGKRRRAFKDSVGSPRMPSASSRSAQASGHKHLVQHPTSTSIDPNGRTPRSPRAPQCLAQALHSTQEIPNVGGNVAERERAARLRRSATGRF